MVQRRSARDDAHKSGRSLIGYVYTFCDGPICLQTRGSGRPISILLSTAARNVHFGSPLCWPAATIIVLSGARWSDAAFTHEGHEEACPQSTPEYNLAREKSEHEKTGARTSRPNAPGPSRASSRSSSTSRDRSRRTRKSAVHQAFPATETQEAFHRALPASSKPSSGCGPFQISPSCGKYPKGTTST